MSAYESDPRVTVQGAAAFKVDLSDRGFDKPGLVWRRGDGAWVASREHGSYHDYPTADEAIRSLIGDAQ